MHAITSVHWWCLMDIKFSRHGNVDVGRFNAVILRSGQSIRKVKNKREVMNEGRMESVKTRRRREKEKQ